MSTLLLLEDLIMFVHTLIPANQRQIAIATSSVLGARLRQTGIAAGYCLSNESGGEARKTNVHIVLRRNKVAKMSDEYRRALVGITASI